MGDDYQVVSLPATRLASYLLRKTTAPLDFQYDRLQPDCNIVITFGPRESMDERILRVLFLLARIAFLYLRQAQCIVDSWVLCRQLWSPPNYTTSLL